MNPHPLSPFSAPRRLACLLVLTGAGTGVLSPVLAQVPAAAGASRVTAQELVRERSRKQPVTIAVRPAAAGYVTGEGEYSPGTLVNVTARASRDFLFTRWEGAPVGRSSSPDTSVYVGTTPVRLVAVFSPRRVKVSARVEPAGTGSVLGDGFLPVGERPVLTALPGPGYAVDKWEGPVVPTGNNPAVVRLDGPLAAPVAVTVRFRPVVQDYCLDVSVGPDQTGATTGGKVEGGGMYALGSMATVRATPAPGYIFGGWGGTAVNMGKLARGEPGGRTHAAFENPSKSETRVTISGQMSVKALFIAQRTWIQADIVPENSGRVTGDTGVRPVLKPSTLRAEPAPGYVFDRWEGPVPPASVRNPVLSLTPGSSGAAISLTARFKPAR
ncbi:hypothetical protein OpiT1DRAFT_04464 [Opitutaceae bacterium TAV1]|nr:hypothetical protein OpiT1DRAFT_04464 [Opitutaceae bacterium TAV1]